jgi:Zn-dependent metalloprotease
MTAAVALAGCSGQGTVLGGSGDDGEWAPTLGSSDKEQALALESLENETGRSWRAQFNDVGTPSFLVGQTASLARTPAEAPDAAIRFLDEHRSLFKMADATAEMRLMKAETDELGHTHVRLEQHVSGVRVYGGDMGVHFDPSGAIEVIAGRYVPDVVSLNVRPSVAENDAVTLALGKLAAARPALTPGEIGVPTAELLVYAPEGKAHLAYRVDVYVDDGRDPAIMEYFVDAHSRLVLATFNNLETVAGSGVGAHGDTKTFDVTGSGSSYSLQSTAINPNGIVTYTAKQAQTQPGTLITSTTTTSWDTGVYGAGSGVDAYVYQGITYSYYKTIQGRNGIDGNDLKQVSTVHYGNKYDNAFWDGTQMVFGDGDGTNFTAFGGSLDVIGHELTHGVTQYTSNLAYSNQTGALNEANSDIMGTNIEFWGGSGHGGVHAGNWLIGEDITPAGSPYAPALRDMAHPKNGQQPDNMSGYVNTSSDNGGVHTNSGIINNFYYLFANGGTNDTSAKAVSGLGVAKAEKIYFYAASHCYTASTNFSQAASCNVTAADTLYGAGSCESITVKNAAIATGITTGTLGTCGACTPVCSGKVCGTADGCGGTCQAGSGCTPACTPVCSGKVCGTADGCGGTCQAGSGCTPACTPVCSGKACGSGDGCGGTCQAGSGCTPGCTPACSGKVCGSADGCGGTCQAGSGCTPACTPVCSGKVCGSADGCGGTCQAGSGCTPACTPSCSGKTCGSSDGCGGTCTAGSGCSSGSGSEVEPNNSRSSATPLAMGSSLTGQISPSTDVDYFRIQVASGSYIHVNVTGLDADCDLKLYNSQGQLLAVSQNSGTTDEDIAGTVSKTVYYAKVYGWNGATCHYTISLTNN